MRRNGAFGVGFAAALVSLVLATAAVTGQGRGLGQAQSGGQGRKARSVALPFELGALNGAAAVQALSGELGDRVRARGGATPEQYAALLAADESAWVTDDGQLLFVDVAEHEASLADPDTVTTLATGPAPLPIGYQPNGVPLHHSKPGAPTTFYLDFDGEAFFSSTAWRISPRALTGLTIDADATTFTLDEQMVVSRAWGRVAEDWAPFNVNVTTERPAVIDGSVLWSLVTRTGDAGFDSSVGGVSLFNFGYMPFGRVFPTFTFWDRWGATSHSDIADTISQENGHMFGLLHDGTNFGSIAEYYPGHGSGPTSWGPIMGSPIGRNVTQWSRGDYPFAVNPFDGQPFPLQDDIAIIAARLGFRTDDFADTIAAAQPLGLPTAGFISSSSDVDVFALPLADEARIQVTPFRAGELTDGGNLDVAIEIVNVDGEVVSVADDLEQTEAILTVALPRGQHFVRVRPSANPANYPLYGSLGAYTITASFTNTVRMTGFDAPLPTDLLTAGRTVPVKFALTAPVALARVRLMADGALGGDPLAETSCHAQSEGRQHCNLKLPGTLTAGSVYAIVAQFIDADGNWATPTVIGGASSQNPLSFTSR